MMGNGWQGKYVGAAVNSLPPNPVLTCSDSLILQILDYLRLHGPTQFHRNTMVSKAQIH